eukprot:CAMPEP_0169253912 /NCGR_PEP_ID=MMETSP1016-20121227/38874_1 /TAXON_ID=342587 /ORGANISM="Karlodinium micrum, Strain CCMP2283" /LENGTH=400 /DNA_ID=CAMNT_0009335297 /DNA_START=28 /DNA_END=1230 /DNA_ORIENTATION=-
MTLQASPAQRTSYYPALRKKGRTPPTCATDRSEADEVEEAIKEIPSPSRARARRAAQTKAFDDNSVAEVVTGQHTPTRRRQKSIEDGRPSTPCKCIGSTAAVDNQQPRTQSRRASSRRGVAAWEVDLADLRVGECIGAGTTAEVFRATWHGTDVAVKRLRGYLPVELQRELSVLSQFRHPNLVLFMGASMVGNPEIVSELCEGGTLFRLIHQRLELSLSWSQRLKVALDTAKGMNFLHRQQVVHRDLKSLNLLLAAQVEEQGIAPWVKVSDFGLSRFLPFASSAPGITCHGMMTGGVGTALWMAPEVLSGNSYSEKVDVYSFAIVLYEVLCRWIPFEGSGLEPVSIAVAVISGRRPDLRHTPPDCPSGFRDLMTTCWIHDPAKRPAFDVVLEMLKEVKCT